jgi:uncharacterized protein involved in exopolysaccharide biosynthesis
MSGIENSSPAPKKRSGKRWWFAWILLGVLGGTTLYIAEPRFYRATTTILIIPQRVPERFVQATVTAGLTERLSTIQQQILSRTRLERIIQEFDLYPAERSRGAIMEDVIEQMRRDINVSLAVRRDDEAVSNFSTSYVSPDPRTAMRVTERLASLFVQENVEDRALLADQTDQFLKGQLDELRQALWQLEARLGEARRRGESLPSTVAADHEILLERYKEISRHSEASKMAVSLERRQIGEQFKIIDGARLPERPISPRLFPYLALGALGGLGSGIVVSMALYFWRHRYPVAH